MIMNLTDHTFTASFPCAVRVVGNVTYYNYSPPTFQESQDILEAQLKGEIRPCIVCKGVGRQFIGNDFDFHCHLCYGGGFICAWCYRGKDYCECEGLEE